MCIVEEGLTLSLLLQCNGGLLVQLERFFLVVVLGVVATQLFAPVPERKRGLDKLLRLRIEMS